MICNMVPSVGGRIVTAGWKLPPGLLAEYERTARTFDADAWMIGRVSMEPYAGMARIPARKLRQAIPRMDFIARSSAGTYAIALDPCGKLAWKSSSIDGEHVITILAEEISGDSLAFPQSKGLFYHFGGETTVNLRRAPEKLRKEFGIRTLPLEGGGVINRSFLAADLVDELSVRVAPIAGGSIGTPSLFDAREGMGLACRLKLVSVEKRAGDLLWLRYKRKP